MPVDRLNARQLFDEMQTRLKLCWIAGAQGESRWLEQCHTESRRPSMVGYLNVIYPHKIQIIGREELTYLDQLPLAQRQHTLETIATHHPVALIITKNQPIPADLAQLAENRGIPLWLSEKRGHELLDALLFHLLRLLAPRNTLHGVFLEVFSNGVLITGEAGSGKSELALELITRGHRLVADDATEFALVAPALIEGSCPPILQDLLEVRGLGVLNIREMFGQTAVKDSKFLRLIIHLKPLYEGPQGENAGLIRLTGDLGQRELFEVPIPMVTIPVAPGRNLAVLVEAAVRNHALRSKGIDPAQTLIERQTLKMRQARGW